MKRLVLLLTVTLFLLFSFVSVISCQQQLTSLPTPIAPVPQQTPSPPFIPEPVPASTPTLTAISNTVPTTTAPTSASIPTTASVSIPPFTPAPTPPPTFAPTPIEVAFASGSLTLKGFIWRPEGAGPFPAILWNHGSEKLPGQVPVLGAMFSSKGYVFFVPHRRGQGLSSNQGPYIIDLLDKELREKGAAARSRLLVELHSGPHLEDQLAALSYLKGLPYVDSNRIAVAGHSFGGIQTMLAAQRDLGLRAAIDLAGAAESWSTSSDLRGMLLTAARQATVPIYFIQAENDYDLTPSKALSEEMQRAGKPFNIKIYPAFGTTAQNGHDFGVRGGDIWGPDALAFLATLVPITH